MTVKEIKAHKKDGKYDAKLAKDYKVKIAEAADPKKFKDIKVGDKKKYTKVKDKFIILITDKKDIPVASVKIKWSDVKANNKKGKDTIYVKADTSKEVKKVKGADEDNLDGKAEKKPKDEKTGKKSPIELSLAYSYKEGKEDAGGD